ncbi:MAG TPA: sigma 54-interacting transcriptional regulator [Candidatus Krumholzibacteria bacterium]|nr:sigma 54-interacting transcriptional regulator [Candidatus Krumholzibacteria bacterium]
MESPVRTFRKNLEPVEKERRAGAWHVAGHVDLVSERRYLVSWTQLDPAARIEPHVITFRCEAACAIAPGGCLPALDATVDGTRIEILTPFASRLADAVFTADAVAPAMDGLLDTLTALDAHALAPLQLSAELVGVDESGSIVILPGAYAFPPDPEAAPGDDTAANVVQTIHAIAGVLAGHANAGTAKRLRSLALAVESGTVATPGAARAAWHGTTGDTTRWLPPAPPGVDTQAIVAALADSKTVEISGPAGSGRTPVLACLAAELRRAGYDVQWIDEWESGTAPRRRGGGKDAARETIWLVDDADERPLLQAAVLAHVADIDRRPGAGLVLATRSDDGPGAFMATIHSRSARGVFTVNLPASRTAVTRDSGLDALDPDERQVLELVAVAGCALPIEVVLSVYPGADHPVHRHILALAGASLLRVTARRLPPGGVSLLVSVPASALRRSVYDRIPESRRRNLHRTIARIAGERGTFAPMFVYQHLMSADAGKEAAACAAEFVNTTPRPQRAPFLARIVQDIVDSGLDRELGYGERMTLLVRVGDDLLAQGKQKEAEALLTRARSIRASSDEIRAHAPLASEAMRLLADARAARGQLREALELLEDTREDIAPYLSLAEQARLLNDIGWLQYRLGDYSSCIESCKFAVNTLNPNEHPIVVAQALNLMGVISFNTSRYDEAISYYEQSAYLREREEDLNALAGSYNNLALAYQSKGEYDKALGYLHKSIGIKSRQNNEAGIAGGYLNLAFLYLEVHNFDEAERRCRDSLRISSELGLAQLIAENLNTLGDIVFARGRLDDAERYYRDSLENARRLSTVNEEMGAQKRLAKLYIRKDRAEDARGAVDEAARLAAQTGSRYEQAQVEEIRGDLGESEGTHGAAIDHFEKAATLYATLSKHRMAAACLAKAGSAHARNGNPMDAKRYLDRAQDLIKSQIGHEIPEEIVTLQQTLRESPLPAGISGTASEKLMYAFNELSSLSDYADDKGAFFRRTIDVFQGLLGATHCTLALRTDDGYVGLNAAGEEEPIVDPVLQAVFARALQLGMVVHCGSPEIKDILARGPAPEPGIRLVIVPMKSMGKELACMVLNVPPASVPETKDDVEFISSIGRHVAGSLRLSLHIAERSSTEQRYERDLEAMGPSQPDANRFQTLIGRDESMKKVFRIIDKIKDMDTGILIFGESGTGKTEIARTIHNTSPRRRHVFQSIHCAEIPSSLLESELFGHERGAFTGAVQRKLGRCEIADGGTVFLDDVNVMPADIQAKLLHYLENKSFTRLGGTQKISTDVRIIAASNEDLERLVKENRFREDLYYRLKVLQLELPPLRERRDDIILIAQEFLKKRCHQQEKPLKRLSSETIKLFQKYRWPGNVRELQNVLEQIVLLCDDDIVEPSSLPEDFLRRAAGGGKTRWQSLEQLARQMVESGGYSESNPLMPQIEALLANKMAEHTDNKSRAAGLLGITKPTLYNRLRGYERFK